MNIDKIFKCYLCGGTFQSKGNQCNHYDDKEKDKEGEVSLCDKCTKKAMNKAKKENTKGLSKHFFHCDNKE